MSGLKQRLKSKLSMYMVLLFWLLFSLDSIYSQIFFYNINLLAQTSNGVGYFLGELSVLKSFDNILAGWFLAILK